MKSLLFVLAASSALAAPLREAIGTRQWPPWWMAPALGILFGVRGAPRCPLAAAAAAAAALAWRRAEGWGPPQLADQQRRG